MMVGDEVYKQVTPAKLRGILAQYEEPVEEWPEGGAQMIRSIADLQQMKEAYLEKMGQYTHLCMVCYGTGCMSSGCKNVRDAMVEELEKAGLSDKVAVIERGCMGTCAVGPVVYVLPDETYYHGDDPGAGQRCCAEALYWGENRSQNILSMTAFRRNGSPISMMWPFSGTRSALRCGIAD